MQLFGKSKIICIRRSIPWAAIRTRWSNSPSTDTDTIRESADRRQVVVVSVVNVGAERCALAFLTRVPTVWYVDPVSPSMRLAMCTYICSRVRMQLSWSPLEISEAFSGSCDILVTINRASR